MANAAMSNRLMSTNSILSRPGEMRLDGRQCLEAGPADAPPSAHSPCWSTRYTSAAMAAAPSWSSRGFTLSIVSMVVWWKLK